jgi:glutamate racemase
LLSHPDTVQLLRTYTAPLLAEGCDTIILGCTHYPFLKPILSQILPPDIRLVDTGAAVARQVERLLCNKSLMSAGPGTVSFWTTSDPDILQVRLPLLWGSRESVSVL